MAAKDVIGSPRTLTLEGIPFRIMGDADISKIISRWENSRIPTSGKSMRKMERRSPNYESVVVAVNADEEATLKSFAESLDDITMSLEDAAGNLFKTTGSIEVENVTTSEGRASCQLQPVDDWTPFVA